MRTGQPKRAIGFGPLEDKKEKPDGAKATGKVMAVKAKK